MSLILPDKVAYRLDSVSLNVAATVKGAFDTHFETYLVYSSGSKLHASGMSKATSEPPLFIRASLIPPLPPPQSDRMDETSILFGATYDTAETNVAPSDYRATGL